MDAWSLRTKLRVGLCHLDFEGNIVSIWNFGEWGDVLREIDDSAEPVGQSDLEVADDPTSLDSPPVCLQELSPPILQDDASLLFCNHCGVTSCKPHCHEFSNLSRCLVCQACPFMHSPLVPRLQRMFTTPLAASYMTTHFGYASEDRVLPYSLEGVVGVREIYTPIVGVDAPELVRNQCWILSCALRPHADYHYGSLLGEQSNLGSPGTPYLESANTEDSRLVEVPRAWSCRDFNIHDFPSELFNDMPKLENVVDHAVAELDIDMPKLEPPNSTLITFCSWFLMMYLLYTELGVADSDQDDLVDIIANCFWRLYVSLVEEDGF
ncbi:hypothetical protein M758_UG018700 [Ceratodon purpureus]|nr:hypothetical protein M758_UG018700 [Ceratodon purpureus]